MNDNISKMPQKSEGHAELLAAAFLFSLPSCFVFIRHLMESPIFFDRTDQIIILVSLVVAFVISLIGRGLNTARQFLQMGVGTSLVWSLLSYLAHNSYLLSLYLVLLAMAIVLNFHLVPSIVLAHLREFDPAIRLKVVNPLILILVFIDATPLVYYASPERSATIISAAWLTATAIAGKLVKGRIFAQSNNQRANQNRSHS